MIEWIYKTFGEVSTCDRCGANYVTLLTRPYYRCDGCHNRDRLARENNIKSQLEWKEKLIKEGRY